MSAGRSASSAARNAGSKAAVAVHPLRREPAVGTRERREVGVAEVGAGDAARVLALLVHADRAVRAVVDDDADELASAAAGAVRDGGGQLLPGHQEVAVAGDVDDRARRLQQRGRDRRRHAVAHRALRSARAGVRPAWRRPA